MIGSNAGAASSSAPASAIATAPVPESLTAPVAASITEPSAALASADALLETTDVEPVASKVRIRMAQAQRRAIPAEVLQHKSGLPRNKGKYDAGISYN